MAIVFLFPTEMEAKLFRTMCPDAEVVICGVGMAAAAATMAQLVAAGGAVDCVLLAGIAGSYDLNDVAMNEVVEVSVEQIEELPDRFRERYVVEPQFGMRTVSSNSVNRSNFRGATAQIENMEGAAVAAICERMKINFSEVRAISNLVGDGIEKWSVESAIETLTQRLLMIYRES